MVLNNQFQSVFTPKSPLKLSQLCIQKVQDLQDEGHLSSDNIPSDLQNKANNMPDLNISVNGIIKLLQGLNPSKAPGPDRINPQLLQKLSLEIAPFLQAIFSRSLVESSLPSDWLKANVSPIFKKGDKSCPANYRPISLSCMTDLFRYHRIICKLMEHIITSNLVKHLDRNQILYDLHHGFRTQLTMFIEELHQILQDGKPTDITCILLDFSKAFDKVSHEKLIYKLHGYGIRGKTLK